MTALGLLFFLLLSPVSGEEPLVLGFLPGLGSLGDNAFNSLAYRGMMEAKRALHARLFVEECKEIAETLPAAKSMLDQGVQIMVLNGYEYEALAEQLAGEYPQVRFILNEIPWPGTENTVSLFYEGYQVAFLAGALAGWTSQTGKVAVVAALSMPIIEEFIQGFRKGIRHADSTVTLEVRYLSETSQGFNMPNKGFEVATELYQNGVDIILALAGLSGNGIFDAARREKGFCIGIDADQDHLARGHILTSLMKNVDKAIETLVLEAARGDFQPGTRKMGLRDGVVGLTPMRFTREIIGDETLKKLEELRQSLLNEETDLSQP